MMENIEYTYQVCIKCATYNHVDYIEDAMRGFVMQKTSFPYVAVVVDDASTDGEPEVIKRFLEREFDMASAVQDETEDYLRVVAKHKTNENCTFVAIFLKYNHYHKKSKKPYFQEWWDNSKYIALCEGDDYWTDPFKLQKQVNVLETDISLMAVCTNASIVDINGNVLQSRQDNVVKNSAEGRYDLRDFFHNTHHYPTATVVYRNTHSLEINKMIAMTANPFFGDWTLWISLHIFGDFYFLDQVTTAYRINPTSVTHSQVDTRRLGLAKANFEIIRNVRDILPPEYADLKSELSNTDWLWFTLANAYRHSHLYFHMLYASFRCFLRNPVFLFHKLHQRNAK